MLALITAALVSAAKTPEKPWRFVNLDNEFYFASAKSEADITEKGFADYIDSVIGGGRVTHVAMCVCGQRASYDSKAWGSIWEAGDLPDQNGATNHPWCIYAKLAHDRGLDPWRTWIERCRAKGVSPLISMRMNDVHYTDQPVHFRHRRFWREHPEFRRKPGQRSEKGRPWNDYALDYTHQEVQEDALAMIKEILRRWDADGLELDWMRFSLHLAYGHDVEGAPKLTSFMRRVKRLVQQAERWRGHGIMVVARVPSTLGSAHGMGYDLETWAKERLIDVLVPCNAYPCSDFDMGLDEWRRKIAAANPQTAVIPGTDICVSCDWRTQPYYMNTLAFLYGWCALAAKDNNDGLYFFNVQHISEMQHAVFGEDLGPVSVSGHLRRFPVTWHDNGYESCNRNWRQLPRLFDGPVSLNVYAEPGASDAAAQVVVSFDAPVDPAGLALTLNGVPAVSPVENLPGGGSYGRNAKSSLQAFFPVAAVRSGENRLEITGSYDSNVMIVWTEVAMTPSASSGTSALRTLDLWDAGKIPFERKTLGKESVSERQKDHVLIVKNVNRPTLTFFPSEKKGRNPGVVICPGGGYDCLAWNKEGTEIARWLASLGFVPFVLKYRVPDNRDGAFCDLQRAVSLVRAKAGRFGVDPRRVGVIGFSAGGNLAARASSDGIRHYAPVDDSDALDCRPDFTMLVYPWALVQDAEGDGCPPLSLRPEFPVDAKTPPAFVVQSEDDCFHVENGFAYALALKRAGVPVEFHVYTDGVHGYGLRNRTAAAAYWKTLAERWLMRNARGGR